MTREKIIRLKLIMWGSFLMTIFSDGAPPALQHPLNGIGASMSFALCSYALYKLKSAQTTQEGQG